MDKMRRHSKHFFDSIEDLVAPFLKLSRLWISIISFVILLSMFEIKGTPSGNLSFSFRLTFITVALVAIIWLPALLKVIALLGGGVKTSAGEASTPGLLAILPKLIATLDRVETEIKEDQQAIVKEIRLEAEKELAAHSPESEDVHSRFKRLAHEYEDIRKTMRSGQQRTLKMEALVAQIRALASRADFSIDEIKHLFNTKRAGFRIIALGAIQGMPRPESLDLILEAIKASMSAFEQYHALRTANATVSLLSKPQKQRLRETLKLQMTEAPGKRITPDSDRGRLCGQILKAIE